MVLKLPNLQRLSDHNFVQEVLKDSTPFMKPGTSVDDVVVGSKESYITRTGYYVGQLLNQTDRIDQAGILINSYPSIRAWTNRYGRFEYFQYHMESYFIAVAGLMDRLLLLVNHLYGMGNDDDQVRFKAVVAKLELEKMTTVADRLKQFQQSTYKIKQSKNDYTHSIRFWEKKLWHIGVLEFALRNGIGKDDEGFLKQDMKFDTRLYRSEKMKLIVSNEEAILEMMRLIYDEFHIQYLLKRNILNNRMGK